MSTLKWDQFSERVAEAGVKNGVLYTIDETNKYTDGVAWNGLTAVDEASTGAEITPYYADDIKYLEITSAEEFAATIGAYTYPDEFKPCIGEVEVKPGVTISQQNRKMFGLVYKTTVMNDTEGMDYGYKLHLVYGARASVSQVSRATINENPDLVTFSWNITTTAVPVTGQKPTAHLVIDTTKLAEPDKTKLATLEDQLFGKDGTEGTAIIPNLPSPDAVIAMFT